MGVALLCDHVLPWHVCVCVWVGVCVCACAHMQEHLSTWLHRLLLQAGGHANVPRIYSTLKQEAFDLLRKMYVRGELDKYALDDHSLDYLSKLPSQYQVRFLHPCAFRQHDLFCQSSR